MPHEHVHPARIAVIGGSSGIGRGIAAATLTTGATIVIAGRNEERLRTAAHALGAPERLRIAVADVTREADVHAFFAEHGPFDHVVVTAADVPGYLPIGQLEVAAARRLIDSKLLGPLLIAKHAPGAMPRGGSITLTAGVAAERPAPGGAVVAAVNGALISLVRALALELAPIRVNALSPGWVETPVWSAVAGERAPQMLEQMAARLPLRRLGTPADVAEGALFAMRSNLLTGAVLPLDGAQRLV